MLAPFADGVALPPGYVRLDWIQSYGGQWIDTGVTGKANTKLTMDCLYVHKIGTGKTYDEFFGSQVEGYTISGLSFSVYVNGNGNIASALNVAKNGDWDSANNYAPVAGTRYLIELDAATKVFTFSSVDAQGNVTQRNRRTHTQSTDGETLGSILLCGVRNNESDSMYRARCSYLRLYSTTIAEGGTPVRTFVPCRSDVGEAGLWDSVEGKFYGNGSGTGRFVGSDDVDVRVSWIESHGYQYIDTGVIGTPQLKMTMDATLVKYNKNYDGWFGSQVQSPNTVSALSFDVYFSGAGKFASALNDGKDGDWVGGSVAPVNGTRYQLELDAPRKRFMLGVNGGAMTQQGTHRATVSQNTNGTLLMFDQRHNGSPFLERCSFLKLYSARIYVSDTLAHDYVPGRAGDGRLGVLDIHNGNRFLGNARDLSYGDFTWGGIAYNVEGGTLKIHEGTLAEEHLRDYTAVEKVDWYELDASAVTSYTTGLVIRKGTFSLRNGAASAVGVQGALVLSGGAHLAIDLLADANDVLTVGALDLSAATAANPVILDVQANGVTGLAEGEARVFISGAVGLTAADAAKFKVTGLVAQVAVQNGALVLVKAASEDAVWTGAAAPDAAWSTAGNWETPLEAGANVRFNLTAGGTTSVDTPQVVKTVFTAADAGAFTHGGAETLAVLAGFENAATTPQAFLMPMTLGVAGVPFVFNTAGDLLLTGEEKAFGATSFVKTGAGTLTLNDEVLAGAAYAVVSNGTLKLNYTGRVTDTATAGEVHVLDGARLDLDMDYGNGATFSKCEPTHAKTVFIEGAGPDGKGVLYNSNAAEAWGVAFSRVVLTGDALVGGPGHFSFRNLSNSAATTTRLEGPHTLTLSNDYVTASSTTWIPNFYGCTFALDRLDVYGKCQFEVAQTGTITNGLHCHGSSFIRFCNTVSFPAGLPLVVDDGTTTLDPNGSATQTFNGAVAVAAGATLETANLPLTLNGNVRVEGALTRTGSTLLTLAGTLSGGGALSGGAIRFSGTNTVWAMEADGEGFTTKVDIEGVTDPAFLTGLKRVTVRYTGDTATPRAFDMGPSGDLVQHVVLRTVALDVTNAANEPVANCWLEVTPAGRLVLRVADNTIIRTATWRGGATGALDDPANWICSNDVAEVEGALPQPQTTLLLPDGCIFNCPAGATVPCAKIAFPASLGGDCDWRGLAGVSIDSTIKLNGHKLILADLTGTGEITDGGTTGYERLAYIQSNAGGEYINTGVIGKSGIQMVLDAQFRYTSSSSCVVGERPFYDAGKPTSAGCAFWFSSNGYPSICYGYIDSGYAVATETVVGDRCVLSNMNARLYKDGVLIIDKTDTQPSFTSTSPIIVFGLGTNSGVENTGTRLNETRIYSLKIYDNGLLVRDFVPMRRLSDGAAGLLNTLDSNPETQFYANKGTGAISGVAQGEVAVPYGEVHIDVPAGATLTTSAASIQINGRVKVVKEGEGTFVAGRQGYDYYGGTLVAAGRVTVPASGETTVDNSLKNLQFGRRGAEITVAEGATFDAKGNYDSYVYGLVLAGGTFANTGCKQANYGSWSCGGDLLLTADSSYDIDYWTSHTVGLLDLGGHELTVNAGAETYLFLDRPVDNGTLKMTGGVVQFRTETPKRMPSLDLVLGGWLSVFDADITVRSLTTQGYTGSAGTGGKSTTILGTYKPDNDYVYNFVLADGVTIDLSGRTTPFDLAGKSLTFKADSTVFVDVRTRHGPMNGPLIAWTAETRPDVTFKVPAGADYGLIAKPDGLYLLRGLTIFVR